MSTIAGHLYVAVPPDEQAPERCYDYAREHAQERAETFGDELLIGPALLIGFHPLTKMRTHLVFPTRREVSRR